MNLRPYQRDAVEAIFREWQTVDATLLVLPTGLGKTIAFAHVIHRAFPRRAMVLAHREELIFQAKEKIESVTGFRVEIEMASQRADMGAGLFGGAQVVVSTIQTQTAGGDGGGRMSRFDPADFGLVIVDEAHHATASTYRRAVEYYRQNPRLKVLGVTATPDRADEAALGQVYESVAYDYEISDAIRDGWLVPIEQQMVSVEGLDFSAVRTTAGDLNGADLAAIMEAEKALHGIAGPTLEIIGQRRALIFAASVAQAERLAEILNRHREGMAAWVCGKTDKDDRRRILGDFKAGRVQVVVNCAVLTEGFDDPGVEVIVMGRPTKSRSLYAQMVGRATRALPGVVDDADDTPEHRRAAIAASAKPGMLVVDFAGNAGRHKLVTSADILGGKYPEEVVQAAAARARQAGKPVSMTEALEDEQRAAEERRQREAARRARLMAKAKFQMQAVSPFDVFGLRPAASRGWHEGRTLTEKQRGILLKQGIDPDRVTFAQGKQLLDEIFRRWDGRLCSFKQAKVLKKYGFDPAASRDEAKTIIDKLAANGWRRPAA